MSDLPGLVKVATEKGVSNMTSSAEMAPHRILCNPIRQSHFNPS